MMLSVADSNYTKVRKKSLTFWRFGMILVTSVRLRVRHKLKTSNEETFLHDFLVILNSF